MRACAYLGLMAKHINKNLITPQHINSVFSVTLAAAQKILLHSVCVILFLIINNNHHHQLSSKFSAGPTITTKK
jgi:hypothetical protein